MPESITSWNRLEPKQRSSDFNIALQARIHDPLWMLARQWQIGEFEGEDAASPIKVNIDASFNQLSRFSSKSSGNAVSYHPESLPLEVAVEKEHLVFSELDFRLRAELGNEFLKLVKDNNIDDPDRGTLLEQVGFSDPDEWPEFSFIKRSIDAAELIEVEVNQLTSAFGYADNEFLQRLEKTLSDWKKWAKKTIFGTGQQSFWNSERQEYAFAVASQGLEEENSIINLSVDQYPGGHLDWPAFTLESGINLSVSEDSTLSENKINLELIPMPVEISGMPAQRWWEFEDNNVDFGSLETSPQDIGRMLIAHFALISGNDWFSIPMELPVGSLTKINYLRVTNTFGEVLDIHHNSVKNTDSNPESPSALESPWRMFQISPVSGNDDDHQHPFFFLPPVLGPSLHSQPIEEVGFMRDEMVNSAWIIERVVQDKITGAVVDRHEKYYNQKPGFNSEPVKDQDTLNYKLTTQVPDYLFPLLHVQEEHGKTTNKLTLGSLLRDSSQPSPELLGEISKELKDSGIFDEEVPRDGLYVYRQFQFTRWYDGSSYLWISRRKKTGKGEGSSNLKFDTI